eukprot:GHVR01056311.1.p1 GENE.GHVR01056311.1~~GHVR01056311.1.p1  ORF type:complete len:142 (-),score=31.23 GHVR01056311.1:7-432(-)
MSTAVLAAQARQCDASGEHESALSLWRAVEAQDPLFESLWYLKGRSLRCVGKPAEAEMCFRRHYHRQVGRGECEDGITVPAMKFHTLPWARRLGYLFWLNNSYMCCLDALRIDAEAGLEVDPDKDARRHEASAVLWSALGG